MEILFIRHGQGEPVMIARDVTITAYRELLGERNYSRRDFLGDACCSRKM